MEPTKTILIAGATGYLGGHLVRELQKGNLPFKAMARKVEKLQEMGLAADQIIRAEVTKPKGLDQLLAGVEVIISTIGITRQKDGLTYMEVDYQGNKNLLDAAKKAGVRKFIYVSAINGDQMRHLKIMAAKELFVDEMKASGLDYAVIRPNGFFSDMKDFLDMAERGRVYLFGHGNYKFNPIHGADLAEAIVASVPNQEREVAIGGPDVLTQNEVATLALKTWKRPVKIVHFPDWIRRCLLAALRTFTSSKTYGPFEFFLTMLAQDNVAPKFGVHRLATHFAREADQIGPAD